MLGGQLVSGVNDYDIMERVVIKFITLRLSFKAVGRAHGTLNSRLEGTFNNLVKDKCV